MHDGVIAVGEASPVDFAKERWWGLCTTAGGRSGGTPIADSSICFDVCGRRL